MSTIQSILRHETVDLFIDLTAFTSLDMDLAPLSAPCQRLQMLLHSVKTPLTKSEASLTLAFSVNGLFSARWPRKPSMSRFKQCSHSL